jgi:preprotein translocase subunit SecG
MYGFLLAVLVLDGLFMSVVILLQAGKGGGLASVGGGAAMTEGILGGRQATTVLTRATWISGSVFMVLALVLSIMSSRSTIPESVIQVPATATSSEPQPVLPGLGGVEGGAAAPAPVGTASPPATPGN